ncbi:hypothetical protein GCM10007094_28390 [Pseudovibrio japonicus]|uniref:N-acetyltransferase domain-containing protein n=1 Tax=Pseudovibrio japonicus TaxID=366534 RepID=A0ABQ3EFX6_9HYPH|nr:GNAT family N-acetyltransferase [Pseudovibrio japonicus]GHB37390.1 hypothetical protein GCM10007094_28390 [Pseudovibrio japonicus]
MQDLDVLVRDAGPGDADGAVRVLRESISRLCEADHENEPGEASRWLANKTVDTFLKWLGDPNLVMRVAVRDGEIAAVGSCHISSRSVVLLYVAPEHRFAGVSSLLLSDLEEVLRHLGSGQMSLESTATALEFYRARGWKPKSEDAPSTLLVKQVGV